MVLSTMDSDSLVWILPKINFGPKNYGEKLKKLKLVFVVLTFIIILDYGVIVYCLFEGR